MEQASSDTCPVCDFPTCIPDLADGDECPMCGGDVVVGLLGIRCHTCCLTWHRDGYNGRRYGTLYCDECETRQDNAYPPETCYPPDECDCCGHHQVQEKR